MHVNPYAREPLCPGFLQREQCELTYSYGAKLALVRVLLALVLASQTIQPLGQLRRRQLQEEEEEVRQGQGQGSNK